MDADLGQKKRSRPDEHESLSPNAVQFRTESFSVDINDLREVHEFLGEAKNTGHYYRGLMGLIERALEDAEARDRSRVDMLAASRSLVTLKAMTAVTIAARPLPKDKRAMLATRLVRALPHRKKGNAVQQWHRVLESQVEVQATAFECVMFALITRAGYRVEFVAERKSKSPDMWVEHARLLIECKFLTSDDIGFPLSERQSLDLSEKIQKGLDQMTSYRSDPNHHRIMIVGLPSQMIDTMELHGFRSCFDQLTDAANRTSQPRVVLFIMLGFNDTRQVLAEGNHTPIRFSIPQLAAITNSPGYVQDLVRKVAAVSAGMDVPESSVQT